MMNSIKSFSIIAILILLAAACIKEPTVDYTEVEQRSLKAWIEKHRDKELLDNYQEEGGYYVEMHNPGVADSLPISGKDVWVWYDFTARDLQREAIAKGLPWELAKGFDHSAALSPEFIPLSELGGDVQNLRFEMELNGEVRQQGFTGDMLFSVDKIISHISKYMTLKIGDLIYTGTPVGVGEVKSGDNIKARLGGKTLLDFDIM